MSTLQLNGKDLASQTSSAECVIASAVTGSPTIALTNATGTMPTGTQDNITRLGTVTAGNLSNTAIVYPVGHVSNVFYNTDVSGDMNSTANAGSHTIACTPISFTTVSGRKYIIIGNQQLATSNETGANHQNRVITYNIYYGTTSRAKSDQTVDDSNLIGSRAVGRNQSENTTAGRSQYINANYTAYFTAGSSATHYVYTTICNNDSSGQKNYGHNDADAPHVTTIFEVMP